SPAVRSARGRPARCRRAGTQRQANGATALVCSSGLGAASVDIPVLRFAGVSPSEREPAESLSALLAAPACAAIASPLRKALLDAGGAGDATRDPPAVIADTLSALAQLEADGEVLAAAVL